MIQIFKQSNINVLFVQDVFESFVSTETQPSPLVPETKEDPPLADACLKRKLEEENQQLRESLTVAHKKIRQLEEQLIEWMPKRNMMRSTDIRTFFPGDTTTTTNNEKQQQ